MNSKEKTRTRAERARMTAYVLAFGWLAATTSALMSGEEMGQAARLGIVTSLVGLIGGAVDTVLRQRDDWPVVMVIIWMSVPSSVGLDPHKDGFLSRLGMGSCFILATLIVGLGYNIYQFRKGGRMAANSPLWDPDVDRATPP